MSPTLIVDSFHSAIVYNIFPEIRYDISMIVYEESDLLEGCLANIRSYYDLYKMMSPSKLYLPKVVTLSMVTGRPLLLQIMVLVEQLDDRLRYKESLQRRQVLIAHKQMNSYKNIILWLYQQQHLPQQTLSINKESVCIKSVNDVIKH